MKLINLEFVELSVNRLVSQDENHFDFIAHEDSEYYEVIDYEKKIKRIVKQGGQITEILKLDLVSKSSVISWELPALLVIMVKSQRDAFDIMDRLIIDTISSNGSSFSSEPTEVAELFPPDFHQDIKNYSYYWYENCMLKGLASVNLYNLMIQYPREIML